MLGVLGGMGPLATAWFYRRVVEATPSVRDQDHLPIVIWGDPTVPDRSSALLRPDAPDPTPWLARGARALVAMGAELIAVPCNSAHPFLAQLQMTVDVQVVDIVRVTVDQVVAQMGSGARVAVLCTEGAHRAEIYQRGLAAAGIDLIDLAASDRRRVQAAIVGVKAGRLSLAQRTLQEFLLDLASARPDLVILGCTELTVLRDEVGNTYNVLDSATVLATHTVATMRSDETRFRKA